LRSAFRHASRRAETRGGAMLACETTHEGIQKKTVSRVGKAAHTVSKRAGIRCCLLREQPPPAWSSAGAHCP